MQWRTPLSDHAFGSWLIEAIDHASSLLHELYQDRIYIDNICYDSDFQSDKHQIADCCDELIAAIRGLRATVAKAESDREVEPDDTPIRISGSVG
jgi:hypothetical protein